MKKTFKNRRGDQGLQQKHNVHKSLPVKAATSQAIVNWAVGNLVIPQQMYGVYYEYHTYDSSQLVQYHKNNLKLIPAKITNLLEQ